MNLSTHYYVLSLGERTNRLYEAFRDSLIDIQNTWFPLESSIHPRPPVLDDAQTRTLMQTVDRHFAHYYGQDPLGVVVAGTQRHQASFGSLTAHANVIIGTAEGDYSSTSMADLGSIVWPVVKGAMAAAGDKIARELDAATRAHNVVVGIDAVVQSVGSGVGATLLVENGYRVSPAEATPLVEECDNVVDGVIERVLSVGGNVIFVEDGSLRQVQRIALILRVPHESSARSAAKQLVGPRAG